MSFAETRTDSIQTLSSVASDAPHIMQAEDTPLISKQRNDLCSR
jgi:hypothetical protein